MRRLAAAVAAAFVAGSVAGARQGQSQLPPPTFRSSVDIVHLDVSVLDGRRRPVRGLTPADFTVLEDGQPQRITVFNPVDIADPEPPAAAWIRDVAPDVRTNDGLQQRRLFLVIVDDATLQSDLNALRNLRDVGRRFIEKLGPSDMAAVIFTRDNRHAQDYTSDRSRLLAALSKASIGFRDMAPPEIGPDDYAYVSSLNVLESALEALSLLPDRRKAIVYLGQGVPVDLDQLQSPAPGLGPGGSAALTSAMMSRFKSQMDRVFERAANANVNVYTLDVCGLRVPPGPSQAPMAGSPTSPPSSAPSSGPGSLFSIAGYARPTCVPGLEVEYLRTVAGATGGRAVADTNDFERGITSIFVENASYYLLGYQSSDPGHDGTFRRLEVRVNRPGVEIRTRRGYWRERASEVEKRRAASPVTSALAGILPRSDLPLQMAAIPVAIPGKREAAVAIVVGVRQPLRSRAERTVERVDMQVAAFDVNGKSFGSKTMRTDVVVRAGASGLGEYEVLARLDLKPGRYQLRVAGHVGSLSTSGSLYYDVDVPDFRAAAVSLSGIALAVVPPLPVGAGDALKGILPIVPTAIRRFTARDRVAAFARLYQGGKGPLTTAGVEIALRNDRGEVVWQRRQDVAAGQFTAVRSANILVDLPVARLPAGEYLLTLETGSGPAAVRRHTRFHVGE